MKHTLAAHGSLEGRLGISHPLSAQGHQLGGIKTVSNPTGCPDAITRMRRFQQGLSRCKHRVDRRLAPLGENLSGLAAATRGRGTSAFDSSPVSASETAHIHGRHSDLCQLFEGSSGHSGSGFLDQDRHFEFTNKALERGKSSAKLGSTFGLQRLLERIQMDDEGLCLKLIHDAANLGSFCGDHLADAQVGNQERTRSGPSQPGGFSRKRTPLQLATLRSDTHHPATLLTRYSKELVERCRVRVTHGHSCDEKGGRQLSAKTRFSDAELVKIQIRKRLVTQMDLLQTSPANGLIPGIQGLVDMLALAELELLDIHGSHYTLTEQAIP